MPEQRRGERTAEHRGEHQEHDEDPARHRDPVAFEPNPDLLPVTACSDGLGSLAEVPARLDRDGCREACLRGDMLHVAGVRHDEHLDGGKRMPFS